MAQNDWRLRPAQADLPEQLRPLSSSWGASRPSVHPPTSGLWSGGGRGVEPRRRGARGGRHGCGDGAAGVVLLHAALGGEHVSSPAVVFI